ncbi:MAG: hypothetical protein HFI93_02850 [Lachnospiraceae bacterium]|nr:hypothetical protein [Lachnospiraceae bacterium]
MERDSGTEIGFRPDSISQMDDGKAADTEDVQTTFSLQAGNTHDESVEEIRASAEDPSEDITIYLNAEKEREEHVQVLEANVKNSQGSYPEFEVVYAEMGSSEPAMYAVR